MCCRVSFSAVDRYSPRATSSNAGAAALAQAHDRADACDGAESAGRARTQLHNHGRRATYRAKNTDSLVGNKTNDNLRGQSLHALDEPHVTAANGASTTPAIGPALRQTD